ncbi:uncharacterized protein [Watersipora subatra]|uniref:uncharacterized protein n=1 Tax=Watersipora subatra TaxID=2589382 RepID=UPI00355C55B3
MSETGASAGIAQKPTHGTRLTGDGGSIHPQYTETSKGTGILKVQLEQLEKKLADEQSEHRITKSQMSELQKELDKAKQENKELQMRLLKGQSESRPLHGTPQLVVGAAGTSENKTQKQLVQRLLSKLPQYVDKIKLLTGKLRQQNREIHNLTKIIDSRGQVIRKAGPISAETYGGAGHTGPSTNMGFTLSLASQNPSTYINRHPETEGTGSLIRTECRIPVERSDHEYGNVQEYARGDALGHPLVIDEPRDKMAVSPVASNRRPPKPKPRTRSLAPGTMKPVAETFEIVNSPPVHSTLNTQTPINESYKHSNRLLHDLPAQPHQLTQRVVDVPEEQALPASSRECGVCKQRFPHLSDALFLEHCLECADQASEEAETGPIVQPAQDIEEKICPVCNARFTAISQSDYENHVDEHFVNEETGWEVMPR